eukprot:CAMPEP_0116838436 /NCGR_PEP_ID=MMETSP0418-20121206/9215_1 /TAXON_ID=1158023 /ORGANISM="Astrosyne radiata, Strain 13vi08-1A" /LENGTH=86 /DNA_ID=CAMNT_0004468445 /DNA_START=44 /DNA_END=301 /DNA_ORIENTATION=+
MIHPDDDEAPKAVLLGALKPVGRIHLVHYPPSNSSEQTEKQKRWVIRKAFRDRLAPNIALKDERDPKRRMTKVVRTRNETTGDYFL